MKDKRLLFFHLLLLFILTACGLFSSTTQFPGLTNTPARPTVTTQPIATIQPTVTAEPLPTWVEKEAPPSTPGPKPTSKQASLLDDYMPRREKVAETRHFILYAQDGYFPVDKTWWLEEIETVFADVSQRLEGAGVKNKILLGFMPPDSQACPVRGLASHDHPPVILIYASPESSHAYLLGVLAHEVGHAISSEGFPEGMPGDLALTEGLATWASEKYWTEWMGAESLDEMVSRYISEGTYEPIHKNYDLHGVYPWQNGGKDCLTRRDKIYTEWASFLGYLIRTYGWQKAHRLFKLPPLQHSNGQVIHFPPDYEGIYGKSLNQLEEEWLNTLQPVNILFLDLAVPLL